MDNKSEKLYFSNLTLLRGFAAVTILMYHIIELLPWKNFPSWPSPLFWFRVGWMGVDIFFVLSGFVIMLSAIVVFNKYSLGLARKEFFKKRIVRILPLYVLTLLIASILLIFNKQIIVNIYFVWNIIVHLLFLHNLSPELSGSINGPNWAVAVEFQFYVLVFILMPWIINIKWWKLLIWGLLVAWSARTTVFIFAEYNNWNSFYRFVYATQLPCMIDEFVFGIVLAKIIVQEKNVLFKQISSVIAFKKLGISLVVLVLFIVLTFAIYVPNATYWNNPWMVIFWRTLLGLSICILIGILTFIPFGAISKSLPYRSFHYLGEISYGIYLWQLIVILLIKQIGVTDPIIFTCMTFFFVFLLSVISWHFFEKPLAIRLLKA